MPLAVIEYREREGNGMEEFKTKLVEEENTIYEIDVDCMRKKEEKCRQQEIKCRKKRPKTGRRNADLS